MFQLLYATIYCLPKWLRLELIFETWHLELGFQIQSKGVN